MKNIKKLFSIFLFSPLLIVSCSPFNEIEDKIKSVLKTVNTNPSQPWDENLDKGKPLNSIISGFVNRNIIARFVGKPNVTASEFVKKIDEQKKQSNNLNSDLKQLLLNDQQQTINSFIRWVYIPGVDNIDVNDAARIEIEINDKSADDNYGVIKVVVKAFDKKTANLLQQREFVISGFDATQTGHYLFKNRIATAFSNLNSLTLKNPDQEVDVAQLTNKNFWNYFNLPENFEDYSQKIQQISNGEPTTPKAEDIAKNPYRLKDKNFYYIKAYILQNSYDSKSKTLDVIVSIFHDNFQTVVSKIIKIKADKIKIANKNKFVDVDSFKLKDKYSNFLPSFLTNTSYGATKLGEYIDFGKFSNYKNFTIKAIKSLSNDQDGSFYILINQKNGQTHDENQSSIASQVVKVEGFNSYEKIYNSKEFLDNVNLEFIDRWYKLPSSSSVAEKIKNISQSLNTGSDSLIWPLFGQSLANILSGKNLFKNTSDLQNFDKNYYNLASLQNFEVDDKGINFYFSNWSQDFYKIRVNFSTDNQANEKIYSDFGSKVVAPEEIKSQLRSRSLAIQIRSLFVDKTTNQVATKVISGTTWVFDRKHEPDPKNPKKTRPTNTYYLATNLHVVSELINNPDQIYSFSYLLNGNKNNVSEFSFDSSNLFRRFDRVITNPKNGEDFLPPEGLQYINKQSNKFWNSLRINPIGLDTPTAKKFRDIAIIEVEFPEDESIEIRSIFDDLDLPFFNTGPRNRVIKNIPDAVKFYNANKLDFLITNQFSSDVNRLKSKENQGKFRPLPIHAYLGGFLGGSHWVVTDQNAFLSNLTYEKNSNFNINGKVEKYSGARSISLPGLRGGQGMSGSLAVNEYNQVIGIFWGGIFPDARNSRQTRLVKGIGEFDPIGIKIDDNPTILAKWLAETKNITTDLDVFEQKTFALEDQAKLDALANQATWVKFGTIKNNTDNENI
ncbi:Uncharacterised protein [Mesomycoplasma conjunctivae]|nr:Uncharacterised protein [Mesomycoplasma conjunctivae]